MAPIITITPYWDANDETRAERDRLLELHGSYRSGARATIGGFSFPVSFPETGTAITGLRVVGVPTELDPGWKNVPIESISIVCSDSPATKALDGSRQLPKAGGYFYNEADYEADPERPKAEPVRAFIDARVDSYVDHAVRMQRIEVTWSLEPDDVANVQSVAGIWMILRDYYDHLRNGAYNDAHPDQFPIPVQIPNQSTASRASGEYAKFTAADFGAYYLADEETGRPDQQ